MKQYTTPLLSIVMPVFNNHHYVKIMIECIIKNTFLDWELLIIDDGSDDTTMSIIKKYISKDSRITLHLRTEVPKGAQTCRNIGLNMAKGEYIIFFDSDDYITEDCLQTRISAIQLHPELDFMVFPSGVVENNIFYPNHLYLFGYPVFKNDIKYFCCRILPFVVWNNIYRRKSLLINNIKWDTNLLSLQDADFNLSTILSGLKYDYYLSPPHFGYRIDANELSVSKQISSEAHKDSNLYAIDKFYQSVKTIFGNKYNMELFMGVCYIYNKTFCNGIEMSFAKQISQVVKKHSTLYGYLLEIIICCSRFLGIFLSPKRARQIPMAYFLWKRHSIEKKKLNRISKIIK